MKTDLEKFLKLMNEFKIETFQEEDECDCTEVRLKNNHHNSVPNFYFDEKGKFISVNTAIANGVTCHCCGYTNSIYDNKD